MKNESEKNKELVKRLRDQGLFALEMYHPDPKRNDEVIAVLASASSPDTKWLQWMEEKLGE